MLHIADSNKSSMDKIYYYIHKATLAIKDNADNLNNPRLFLPPEEYNGKNG